VRGAFRDEVRDDVHVVLPEGIAPPAGVPAEMFAAAVDAYLAGRRLDMQSLARRLGVSRATPSGSTARTSSRTSSRKSPRIAAPGTGAG